MLARKTTSTAQPARRRGAFTVEFALTVPVLFLVFFGLIEFCRFNMVRHGVDSAVYEGARRGIVPGARVSDVQAATQRILDAVSIIGATIEVDPAVITTETETVTVSVTVPFNRNGWVVPRFLKDTTLARSCTLSRELTE
jgi:Flp pilus assembly protein TadG